VLLLAIDYITRTGSIYHYMTSGTVYNTLEGHPERALYNVNVDVDVVVRHDDCPHNHQTVCSNICLPLKSIFIHKLFCVIF